MGVSSFATVPTMELVHVLFGVVRARPGLPGPWQRSRSSRSGAGHGRCSRHSAPALGQHPGAVRAAHLADAGATGTRSSSRGPAPCAAALALHAAMTRHVIVHAAVNEEGFVHRGGQLLACRVQAVPRASSPQQALPGSRASSCLFCPASLPWRLMVSCRVVQHLFPHCFQLFAPSSCPVGLFQQTRRGT